MTFILPLAASVQAYGKALCPHSHHAERYQTPFWRLHQLCVQCNLQQNTKLDKCMVLTLGAKRTLLLIGEPKAL